MPNQKRKVVRRVKVTSGDLSAPTSERPAANNVASGKRTSGPTKTPAKVIKKTNRTTVNQTASQTSPRKTFILLRPVAALLRYIRNSWRELKLVEWPNRRATWKMTLGVIAFCVFIGVFVLLCDWLSQMLIKEVIL